MDNVFVQGAGKPDEAAQAAITKLGKLLKKKGCKCHVGSKGAIPDILQKTGIPCARHAFEGDKINELTWANRLAHWVSQCDTFIFFKGDAGTLAHLFPVLAFAKKRWAKEGSPRRIVLIGWQWEDALAIQSLIGFTPNNVPEWFHSFKYNQIDEAMAFLE